MTVQRQLTIQPYQPDETENLGDNTGQFSDSDLGKPVKYSGDTMVLCADGDEIAGFVQSINPGTKDGHSVGGVRKVGRVKAIDEAGTLSVGDLAVAGTPVALGTSGVANVKVAAGTEAGIWKWVVLAVYSTGAGRGCLLGKV